VRAASGTSAYERDRGGRPAQVLRRCPEAAVLGVPREVQQVGRRDSLEQFALSVRGEQVGDVPAHAGR